MSEHGESVSTVNTLRADPGPKFQAPKSVMAGMRQILALAAVVLVGGVTACSSSASAPAPASSASQSSSPSQSSSATPAPQTNASEASGIPADVIVGYLKASCTAPGTYDQATEVCTDKDGQAMSVREMTAGFSLTPVRVMQVGLAYAFFTPEKFSACPSKADMDTYQNDKSNTVDPPTVSDECLTSVLVAMTSVVGAFGDAGDSQSSTSTGDASGSAAPVVLGTTCLSVSGEDPQCWDGNTWHYSECWNTGPKVELQYWDDSKWVTLAKDFAVEDGCSGDPSWTVATEFSEPDTGETKYRLKFPSQAGQAKLTVNFSTEYTQ